MLFPVALSVENLGLIPRSSKHRHPFPRRYFRFLSAGVLLLTVSLYFKFQLKSERTLSQDEYPTPFSAHSATALPPLYEKWTIYERNLPQHKANALSSESQFLFMANHAHGVGWGNVLQEMFLNAHLAYLTKRTFVFNNYTWDRSEADYSEFKGKIIPSRIPVSTMLSGPIIGTQASVGSVTPYAVSREFFRSVCPSPSVLELEGLKADTPYYEDGFTLMKKWVERINAIDDPCIEISSSSPALFDMWFFFQSGVLSLWPSLRSSPLLTEFSFAPLIESAFSVNRHLFISPSHEIPWSKRILSFLPDVLSIPSVFQAHQFTDRSLGLIPGLMTIHIRRGDFVEFCRSLEQVNSTFQGFNAFPEMLDKFNLSTTGESPEEKWERYRKHCLPSMEEIVEKVGVVRKAAHSAGNEKNQQLDRLYIMSNAPRQWLEELKEAIRQSAHSNGEKWEEIYSSRDLSLTWEQKYVAQTVDMYIATKSQTFIGNGFSSLSSNIMMLRMAKDVHPLNSRLW
ncbi:hypothetical protein VKT23_010208 [Stygiomarasmius scandens]|uniref:GDP-fucose protein O-fucosyltransferase 2 n=1 Tax=Marasmiellus scandens TaxID=2682957 RepID=A0ABR1JCD0_9AGAR